MFHRITESSGLGDTSRSIYSSHQPSTATITLVPQCHIKNNYSYNPSPTERIIPYFKENKPHKNAAPLPAQEIGTCVKQAGSDVPWSVGLSHSRLLWDQTKIRKWQPQFMILSGPYANHLGTDLGVRAVISHEMQRIIKHAEKH